ncbi:MAG TPA: PTS sugar transporter subunit IIA [Ignavibacteriaceae bacterium]|jgi:fructose-specific phosphotransferase system IIA component|nr:MAG: PTS system fructose-specific EIIABC component [Ignavibacteria bacterium ADurb.Bin266]OQY71861.1 MAG: PTS sugar transporter subunit IIA [Ignavibacteriales bacterium UTCHB2]HQF44139.1 PTS sugar transporter subunit IIA [Ignavibacteriaceae bacterium]HQI41529.1 PTS sugar transporter subunit IIA [Ignavibacteriaceae bacterium]HQJ46880.1 PTS sugar transporter subunit IIA [Ignavibacteriaceae bacterium]
MKVSDLLKPEFIIPHLTGETKEEVINKLIDLFKNDERVEDLEKVRSAVLEREKIMSTGVGKGFAIPHGKTNAVNEIIGAFGRIDEGIDYDSLDGNSVQLIFLLVGKDNLISTHIKLLSRISRLMNKDDFRHRLIEANNKEDIIKLFTEEEEHFLEL